MINRNAFYRLVRDRPFNGVMLQTQVDGINAILDKWEEAPPVSDLRWLGYMLGTTKLETASTMQPINEYGGNDYFFRMYDKKGTRPEVARDLGNTEDGDGIRFHGRGYVQLTGRRNYGKASTELGVDFVANPELALKPDLAAAIMFRGMEQGWFTGKKLPDYFNDRTGDWIEARRIINGLDKAAEISGMAQAFWQGLIAP